MKKQTKEGICIEYNDVFYVLNRLTSVPEYVETAFRELLQSRDKASTFTGPIRGEVESWIKKQDWIINFSDYDGVSSRKVRKALDKNQRDLEAEVEKYAAADESYRKKHYYESENRKSQLRHKRDQLENMLRHVTGKRIIRAPA